MIGWIFSLMTIFGAVLNAKGNKWGFIVWIIANICWIIFNIITNTISQIPAWIVLTIISAYGFYKWSRMEVQNGNKTTV